MGLMWCRRDLNVGEVLFIILYFPIDNKLFKIEFDGILKLIPIH